MMTEQERVKALHARMTARWRMRERRKTSALAAGSAGLTLSLMLMIFVDGAAHSGGVAGIYTGAVMLFDGIGAHVLVGLLAFMAGTATTVLCIRSQRKKQKETKQKENSAYQREANTAGSRGSPD